MSITRRHFAVAGAFALGGWGLLRSSSVVAESADEAAVAQAVEALRKAILGQEKPQLEALTADQLSYGHSDGRVENKAQFINGVMTRKALLKSLTLSDHTIAIVGSDAIARHTWASESETDGKLTSTKIGVLQVWQKQDGAWKLLARQSVRPPQAQASWRSAPASVTPHSTGKMWAASPVGAALLASASHRGIRQGGPAAGGVVQTRECTVTLKCEGCGVRKPEDERYRPRSAFTVCSQVGFDTAAQKKAQTLHDPRRRDLLATDWSAKNRPFLGNTSRRETVTVAEVVREKYTSHGQRLSFFERLKVECE